MRSITLSLFIALSLVACGKSDKDAPKQGATEATKPAETKPVEQTPAGPTAIPALGIKATLPAGAKIGEGIAGDGVLIQAPDLVVSIEEASDTRPATIDAAKEDADMYSPQNVQAEELADGFALTYENEGGMGKNYFVSVRRDIGGKAYWCSTTASNPAQSTNALAVCKSLQP